MGLWGLLVAQGLVQASYNNWKWPKEILRDLDISGLDLIIRGNKEFFKMLLGRK